MPAVNASRGLKNREGAFSSYKDQDVKLVGCSACGGYPGGNVEYCVEEMKKNGADVVHFAIGMVVRYPPCPYVDQLRNFVKPKYKEEQTRLKHNRQESPFIFLSGFTMRRVRFMTKFLFI